MKTAKNIKKKTPYIITALLTLFLMVSCNPNKDTGENLVDSDIGDPSTDEIDIYVLNENTLYGLRDNNSPSVSGIGTIEPFLIKTIPGYASSSSPVFSFTDEGNGSYYEGKYTDTGLLVSSTDGILYQYNIPGGDILWQTDLGGTSSATPSTSFYNFNIREDIICVGTNNGQLHFINRDTGEIHNTYTNPNGAGFNSKAAITFDRFIGYAMAVGSTDGLLYYFRRGDFIRSFDTGAPILAAPIIQYNNDSERFEIIVGNQDGNLLKIANGKNLIWNIQLSGTIYAEPTSGRNGELYVTTTNGMVYQIDKTTGNIDWAFQAEALVYSSVEVYSLLYFTSTDGSVYALNQSGVLQWKTDLGDGALYATPNFTFIREDQLYINTINGVYGLNANTGEVFSNYTVEHSPNADVSGNFKSSTAVFAFHTD